MGSFKWFALNPTPARHPLILFLGRTDSSHQKKVEGEKKGTRNLASCSLNIVVWMECEGSAALGWQVGADGERRWEPPWDCLAASASGLGASNDALTLFLWQSPTSATHRDHPLKYNMSTQVQLELYLSTIVPQIQNKILSVCFKTRAWMKDRL